ncbi:bifunctional isopimaradiene synthase, chloroplastic isoform X1 [Selaginella moellendorffii]|uniref:bifunctional isopimaradiene synthase, chloroplastic isoform X1 n=1 Tax=Selaginella moellendorffii TaxID=88036 RepID=UPI000D1CB7EE|nr:bifunctional isopimaradiene synthase, chloroplastic isoform X1 [Selaginella moellendorffii]XP_024525393.1 bifunctional isopimaradiene synthase, chloroplastic isoform X1 [Selaginella moellendorffii]XP_024525394.1 bifunctional isopimaradiene synthase, chloroplastic isoform X1 [Selaginella moellendorffii]XP_024525395.1 bifunctional isopimaradiene synthase, chloroplastic isoform X1 [Selaginella moellendorffii]|eukprot:XP_024525392.1 bifunctional isopimaradiene synthase, chloroplastic isoform X1 [Selaginella moellendorffii]
MSFSAIQISSGFFTQDNKIKYFHSDRRSKALNVGSFTQFSAGSSIFLCGFCRHKLVIVSGLVLRAGREVHGTLSIQSHLSSKESTIKKLFAGVNDASGFSAYDMGWIARIPHAHNPELGPQFPRSLEWIVHNQCEDGSWDQGEEDVQRVCSTLSCVTALKTWNRGECSVQRGVSFLMSRLPLVHNKLTKDMKAILHRLLQEGKALDLELNYDESFVQYIREQGQEFLQRVSNDALDQYPTSFVHMLEAFHDRPKWQHLLRYQSSSGSLFSVTLTACAYMHTGDRKCLRFLNGLLEGPLTKPNKNLSQLLRLVDWLEHLGIERFFEKDIEQTLIQAFRFWRGNAAGSGSQQHLKSFEDSALLFRILRRHGYEVSPDVLHQRTFCETRDLKELSLASHFLFPSESRKMLDSTPIIDVANQETTFPWYSIPHRVQHIEYMTKFMTSMDSISMSERASLLAFTKFDFNACQKIYRSDLQRVMRWNEECDFGRLGFARQKEVLCFFTAAATMFQPELSMARIVWAQMSVLATVIDDFMDTHDSLDNLRNFCTAVKRWDPSALELNEAARIIFQGLFKTVTWTAECASAVQGRDMTANLRAQWERLCDAFFREAEWRLTNHCPSLEEYMENGITSFALEPIILSAILFLDEKVESSVLDHPDCINMYVRVSTIGRLLNDIQGFHRESSGGEFSWIAIYMKEHPGTSVEDAVVEIRKILNATMEELVEDVLRPRAVPKRCKRVFENMMRILNFVYHKGDGFSTDELRGHVKQVLHVKLE